LVSPLKLIVTVPLVLLKDMFNVFPFLSVVVVVIILSATFSTVSVVVVSVFSCFGVSLQEFKNNVAITPRAKMFFVIFLINFLKFKFDFVVLSRLQKLCQNI